MYGPGVGTMYPLADLPTVWTGPTFAFQMTVDLQIFAFNTDLVQAYFRPRQSYRLNCCKQRLCLLLV